METIQKLREKNSLEELFEYFANQFRYITRYDRVMIYKFDEKWNGQVVAESKEESLLPFLGLHYPASDIPPQARAL